MTPVEFLVSEARPVILERFSPSSCIASTRIAVQFLRAHGIRARAQATRVRAFNPAATAAALARVHPDEWPDDAYVVEVAGNGTLEPGAGWDGHLVVVVPESDEYRVLVDLSLDQASRPARDLVLGPTAFVFDDWPTGREFENGCSVAYDRIESRSYRSSPNWGDPSHWNPTLLQLLDLYQTRTDNRQETTR